MLEAHSSHQALDLGGGTAIVLCLKDIKLKPLRMFSFASEEKREYFPSLLNMKGLIHQENNLPLIICRRIGRICRICLPA